MINISSIEELQSEYNSIKHDIIERLNEFREIWEKGSDEDIFYELIFCLMTPQSKAELCWESVLRIKGRDISTFKDSGEILDEMRGVRFKFKKSLYIMEARGKFYRNGFYTVKSILSEYPNDWEKREWLNSEIKGIGLKEAGHFLRNIGFGKKLAILDRHILKNLRKFGVIDDVPSSMTPTKYFDIEREMILFSEKINIPLLHLDLLFWYREVGKIFK